MHHLRLALATRCLELPLRQSLRAASDDGAAAVQFDIRNELRSGDFTETGRRQFLHAVDELGLRVASTTFPTRRGYTDQEQLDARVAATRAAMDFSFQLRATTMSVRFGKIPAEKDSDAYRLLHDVVGDLAQYGNQVGVTLAAIPMHDSPAVLSEFVESIKTGRVGIDFDPAAFVMAGHNPGPAYRQHYRSVVHITARDAIRDVDAGGLEVPLGRGEVDWIELLALLEESAYPGWTTVVRTQGEDKPGDVARALQYLTNVGMT